MYVHHVQMHNSSVYFAFVAGANQFISITVLIQV